MKDQVRFFIAEYYKLFDSVGLNTNYELYVQNQHLLEHPFSSKLDTLIDLYLN